MTTRPKDDIVDVAVIGAGPAGLAAAVGACCAGASRVVVLERDSFAGGVLPQCVHDGFGLHLYGRSLTGPEYAQTWLERAQGMGVHMRFGCSVLNVQRDSQDRFALELAGDVLVARSVVVATGCRERTRGQLGIPGTRPSGIMTAGSAQYLVNVKNQLPGTKVVILGSGDIGLIMARRLTLEGAEVRLVLGQEATGLLRNHLRCIRDFDIPLKTGWGVASVHGTGTLKGVMVAPILEDGSLDLDQREYVRCNLLLLACGLIPEREVIAGLGADVPGLFVCGNANAPHDLVDQVTQEGLRAGIDAARHVLGPDARHDGGMPGWVRDMLRVEVREPKGHRGALDVKESSLVPCTICPSGCIVEVLDGGGFAGNGCARGIEYARRERSCPHRLFTGTVKVAGSDDDALVPVRTSAEIPRASLVAVARLCRRIVASANVRAGDVIATDVAGTGADLVACADARGVGYVG